MMKLTGSPLSQPIQAYCNLVDEAIEEMDSARAYRLRKVSPNQWISLKGSAFTLTEVREAKMNGVMTGFLQSVSPFCHLPEDAPAEVLQMMMRYNQTLPGAFFAMTEGYIVLKMIRELEGLDKSEVVSQIQTVGYVSDQLDNLLLAKHSLEKVDVNIELVRTLAHIDEIEL